MSNDDAALLNLPGNEHPITELFAFVAVDGEGKEGICSASIGGGHWAMVTTRPDILAKMRVAAREISKHAGKPIRLVRFTQREVVETITAGMN